MSNLIYTDNMYNEFQKNRFLNNSDLSEGTAEGYKIVFKKTSMLENQFNKDLYDFNLPEIEQVLKHLGAGVTSTVSNYISIIKSYIYWAIKEDLRSTNRLNPLNDVTLDQSYYEQFIEAPRDKKLFTEKTIWIDIIQKTINPQDSCIIALLFEGLQSEEILNLKKSDVREKSLFLTNDKGETREIEVDERTIILCNKAIEQEDYEKSNGNSTARAKVLKIVESEFVIRPVNSRTTKGEGDKADIHTIYRRLKMLGEQLDFAYLTSMNIRNSGMLKLYREIWLNNSGVVEKEDFFSICFRFGLPKSRTVNNEIQYNHYPLKASYLNEEMMRAVYGEEIPSE